MADFDIAIIGGGAAGVGAAIAAGEAGMKAILFEKSELFSGVSANSLGIIHGGFRHLQHLNFKEVLHGIKDQMECYSRFGPALSPLKSRVPTRGWVTSAPILYGAGLLYSGLLRVNGADVGCPYFSWQGGGGLVWHDYQISNMAKLRELCMAELGRLGVTVRIGEAGSVDRILAMQGASSPTYIVAGVGWERTAKYIINAANKEIPALRPQTIVGPPIIRWVWGFNIVVAKRLLPAGSGLAIPGHDRSYFMVARDNETTAFGTQYIPSHEAISPSVISDFVSALNRSYGRELIKDTEVVSIEAGWLPAGKDNTTMPASAPHIFTTAGYLEFAPHKLTSFLRLGRECVRAVIGSLSDTKYIL